MSKVHVLHFETREDVPADRVLEAALGEFETVVVIGKRAESGQVVIAASAGEAGEILLDLELAKQCVLEAVKQGY